MASDLRLHKAFGIFLVAGSALARGLLYKGFTVNTLTNGRICFVGCNAHLVESAVIFIAAMIFTLLYRTFDGGIGRLVFHVFNLPDLIIIWRSDLFPTSILFCTASGRFNHEFFDSLIITC